MWTWLGDVTELWGFDCRLGGLFCGTGNWDVKVDRPYMLLGPAETFALGLYDVTAWCSSLVDNGPGDVLSSAGDWNSTSWLGPSS